MVKVITLDRARATLGTGGLRTGLHGALLMSDDEGYEATRRVWNGNVDRRPALGARMPATASIFSAR
jgi:hypothetical protein